MYNFGYGLDVGSNSANYTSSSNLKGHWNFNEGSGSVLTDLSSSGNNGTIYSAVFNTDDDLDHQNNSSQLSFSWDGADENSGIAGYEYALGTTSGGTETILSLIHI